VLPVDLQTFIRTVGPIGVALVIFAESGLFIGFFLPGDSLLFTAGVLAAQGYFDIRLLSALCLIGAVAGVSVGYAFGTSVGPRLFSREDSLFFHKRHLERARIFYERHGGKAILLARFLPVVRTFAPIVAGMGRMRYLPFLAYNIAGAFVWAFALCWAGYFLGSRIPDIDRYLLPIIAIIIVVSIAPSAIHVWRESGDEVLAWARMRFRGAQD
jgi:membrane-associated protein